MQDKILQELDSALALLQKVISDKEILQQIESAATLCANAIKSGNKVISCGNGGSHCDAMHFAEELSGRYRENRKALPAIAISDPSHITCVGNDYGFEHIFARFIEGLGQKGDVLLGISTSGNSKNIIEAVKAARAKEMKVWLLLGKDGGALKGQGDVEIIVPYHGYADRIQEIHIKIIHIVIMCIEQMTTNP